MKGTGTFSGTLFGILHSRRFVGVFLVSHRTFRGVIINEEKVVSFEGWGLLSYGQEGSL